MQSCRWGRRKREEGRKTRLVTRAEEEVLKLSLGRKVVMAVGGRKRRRTKILSAFDWGPSFFPPPLTTDSKHLRKKVDLRQDIWRLRCTYLTQLLSTFYGEALSDVVGTPPIFVKFPSRRKRWDFLLSSFHKIRFPPSSRQLSPFLWSSCPCRILTLSPPPPFDRYDISFVPLQLSLLLISPFVCLSSATIFPSLQNTKRELAIKHARKFVNYSYTRNNVFIFLFFRTFIPRWANRQEVTAANITNQLRGKIFFFLGEHWGKMTWWQLFHRASTASKTV